MIVLVVAERFGWSLQQMATLKYTQLKACLDFIHKRPGRYCLMIGDPEE